MSIGAIKALTSKFKFNKINFNFPRWHSYEHDNWDLLDAILATYVYGSGIKGIWQNSTAYAVNDRLIDDAESKTYLCLVAHTTPATPTTFAQDRVANPTRWKAVTYDPSNRGAWASGTIYSEDEFVVSTGKYAVVAEDHTSTNFDDDVAAGKLVVLLDVTSIEEMISVGGTVASLSRGGFLSAFPGTPMPDADVVGATSVYLVGVGGLFQPIYSINAGAFISRPFAANLALALNPAMHLANKNFSVFAHWTGSAVRLGTAYLAWPTDTSPGTGINTGELEEFQGKLVNKNAITLHNGGVDVAVSAREATFIGGFRTTLAGQTEDSFLKRFVSNASPAPFHKIGKVTEAGVSWNYSTAAYRQANANTANKIEFFNCLAGRPIRARLVGMAANTTANQLMSIGIGLDSITADYSTLNASPIAQVTTIIANGIAEYAGYPGIGYHYVSWLERASGVGTGTFYGTVSTVKAGMTAEIWN